MDGETDRQISFAFTPVFIFVLTESLYSQLSSAHHSSEMWLFLNKLSNTPENSSVVKKAISVPTTALLQVLFKKSFGVEFNLFLLHKQQRWWGVLEKRGGKSTYCWIWGFSSMGECKNRSHDTWEGKFCLMPLLQNKTQSIRFCNH